MIVFFSPLSEYSDSLFLQLCLYILKKDKLYIYILATERTKGGRNRMKRNRRIYFIKLIDVLK